MQITTRHARQRNGAIKRPNPISGKPKMYAIGIFSGVPSIVDVTAHRDDASKNENTVIQPKSVARPNLFEESIGVLFKRHNVSDHRVRTIDLLFQNHAQAGLRVHRIVTQRSGC